MKNIALRLLTFLNDNANTLLKSIELNSCTENQTDKLTNSNTIFTSKVLIRDTYIFFYQIIQKHIKIITVGSMLLNVLWALIKKNCSCIYSIYCSKQITASYIVKEIKKEIKKLYLKHHEKKSYFKCPQRDLTGPAPHKYLLNGYKCITSHSSFIFCVYRQMACLFKLVGSQSVFYIMACQILLK